MAIVDFVKWDANNELYAWKFPSQELSTWTQLIVSESQEAYVFKGGVMEGPFGPGRHTLSTQNIPLIVELMKLPFGGKTPFTAEVWFVNKSIPLDVKWGTSEPIQVQDPKFNIMLPVRASGQFGVQISDTKTFLKKLVGTLPDFDRPKLISYFRGIMISRIVDCIARYMIKEKLSILEISAYITQISATMKSDIENELPQFGVSLINFYVNSINAPEDDVAVKQLKMALAKKAEMDIIGFTYHQERSFDAVQTAAGNKGMAGNVMGVGMGMGMGVGMGAGMGNMMSNVVNQVAPGSIIETKTHCLKCAYLNSNNASFCGGCGLNIKSTSESRNLVKCDKCGTESPKEYKFCPNCADPFFCCTLCGVDNPIENKICFSCGTELPTKCIKCDIVLPANSKYCMNCGIALSKKCMKCNFSLNLGATFCPECGNKI